MLINLHIKLNKKDMRKKGSKMKIQGSREHIFMHNNW